MHAAKQALPWWGSSVALWRAGEAPCGCRPASTRVVFKRFLPTCPRVAAAAAPFVAQAERGPPRLKKRRRGTTSSILSVLNVGAGPVLAVRRQYASTVAVVWGNTRGQSPASILFPEFPVTPVLRRPRGRAKFTNMPAGGGRCAARIVGRGCVGQRRVCGGGGRFNACAAQQLASEGVSWPAGRSCTPPPPQRSGALGDSVCKILAFGGCFRCGRAFVVQTPRSARHSACRPVSL